MMDIILSSAKCHFSLKYLDSIVIISKSCHELINIMPRVLTLLNVIGVNLTLNKCEIFTNQMIEIGHFINP